MLQRMENLLLISIAALLLARGATPANARFYTFWRCGEVIVQLTDNQERKAMGTMPGKHPDTWRITFEGIRQTTVDRRGLKFQLTDDGPALNGKLCETMPDEEWDKLHPQKDAPQ